MNATRPESRSKPFFGPRDLLLNAVFCHVFATVFLFHFLLMALFMSHPHQFAAMGGIALFTWAWRSRRWIPSVLFLLFTIGFWLFIVLPWRGYGQ